MPCPKVSRKLPNIEQEGGWGQLSKHLWANCSKSLWPTWGHKRFCVHSDTLSFTACSLCCCCILMDCKIINPHSSCFSLLHHWFCLPYLPAGDRFSQCRLPHVVAATKIDVVNCYVDLPPLDEFDRTKWVGSHPWCRKQARCPRTGVFRPWAAVERPWPTTPVVLMFVKIAKLRLAKKSEKKWSDVELRRESAYDSKDIYIRGCMYQCLAKTGKNEKS